MGFVMKRSLLFAFLIFGLLALGQQQTGAANLKFTVLKELNGKPVRNASVILHTVDKEGKQGKGGLQTKTNSEGKCEMPAIPYGKLRVQVIAQGMQTYGQDVDINQPEQEFVIKLKSPRDQYSIYK